MTTLSTHDTKRSEDVRARLAVLAELPDRVGRAGARGCCRGTRWPTGRSRTWCGRTWSARGRCRGSGRTPTRRRPPARPAPRPPGPTRMQEFEAAAARAGRRRLRRRGDARPRIEQFVARIAPFGWSNSLAQKLLQLTMPGVPDVYQGTELWDLSLVDPDNRRPVDYDRRRAAAGRARRGRGAAGRRRRARPSCWWSPGRCGRGATTPSGSPATRRSRRPGPAAEHVVAFDRGGVASVTVATRLPAGLAARRLGRHRPAAAHRRVARPAHRRAVRLRRRRLRPAALLARLPVALLVRD